MAGVDSSSTATTPLIHRAHTEPHNYVNEYKGAGDYIFDTSKPYKSHGDILQTPNFEGFSIRRVSVEIIPIKRAHRRREGNEQVLVPSRDVLSKLPFFSTPLTLEATNNAFYEFRDRLTEMGFKKEAEAALVHTQCESVENAITFILTNIDAIYHRFEDTSLRIICELKEEDIDRNKLCTRCRKPVEQHLIDQNGNKIFIRLNEDNYNEYLNELQYLDEMATILDRKEEETIDFRAVSINSASFRDILERTQSLLPPSPVYNDPKQQCLICFDEKPSNMFMQSECGHDQYCNECLTEHYRIKIRNGDVLKVKCIDMKCDREVQEDEILNFLTDYALKQKFHKFKRQKLLMLDENARFCPSTDCEGYMIGSRLKPKLVCPECNTIICFNCSKLWHGYFTRCRSAQNASMHEMDEKFFQWELNKKDNVKKCPKCKIRIEKNEGCNHMTCVSCKYEFCWICKGKYTSNHYKKWNIFGCPGAQFGNTQIWSIQRCPDCCPMCLRRLLCVPLMIVVFILVVPIVILIGILSGLLYGCVWCLNCLLCDLLFD